MLLYSNGSTRQTTVDNDLSPSMTMNGELRLRGADSATEDGALLSRAETIAVARLLRTWWPEIPEA